MDNGHITSNLLSVRKVFVFFTGFLQYLPKNITLLFTPKIEGKEKNCQNTFPVIFRPKKMQKSSVGH